MITYLNKKGVIPEIEEIFGVINDQGQILNVKCIESDTPDSCRGCAFENLCEAGDYNVTQYTCSAEERPDEKNVLFRIIG